MSESDLARRCRSTDVLPNPETPRRLVLQALDIVPIDHEDGVKEFIVTGRFAGEEAVRFYTHNST